MRIPTTTTLLISFAFSLPSFASKLEFGKTVDVVTQTNRIDAAGLQELEDYLAPQMEDIRQHIAEIIKSGIQVKIEITNEFSYLEVRNESENRLVISLNALSTNFEKINLKHQADAIDYGVAIDRMIRFAGVLMKCKCDHINDSSPDLDKSNLIMFARIDHAAFETLLTQLPAWEGLGRSQKRQITIVATGANAGNLEKNNSNQIFIRYDDGTIRDLKKWGIQDQRSQQ